MICCLSSREAGGGYLFQKTITRFVNHIGEVIKHISYVRKAISKAASEEASEA